MNNEKVNPVKRVGSKTNLTIFQFSNFLIHKSIFCEMVEGELFTEILNVKLLFKFFKGARDLRSLIETSM